MARVQTFPIEIDGITLQVTGVFHKGYPQTWTDPGEPDSFEVRALTDSGVDVLHLYDEDEVHALAVEARREDDEFARDCYYEGLREERRLGC